jgi:hypothetical protein
MKGTPEISYRNIAILFAGDSFWVDGESGRYDTLEKACDKIDAVLKSKVVNTAVFYDKYNFSDEPERGVVTSISAEGEFYISHPEKKGKYGSRERLSKSTKVFLDTPENWEKYEQIKKVRAELKGIVAEYQMKASAIVETMEQPGVRA